ncbi:MAG TPA: hypothetical protein PKC96_00890 [Bacilli bacterium]|nr:hypothetical protein [Bacilli bacterium]
MKETKSVTVSPSQENAEIAIWSDFGWELQSSQEIFNQDSGLKRRGDTIYNVTTTTNYVKLVFQRDNSIANYSQIRQKETEFDSLLDIPLKHGPAINIWWIISFLLYGIGLVIFIILKVINKKHNSKAKPVNEKNGQRRAALRREARALLS